MYTVLVVVLPILIVVLIVVIVRRITTVAVIVLVALLIVRSLVFAVPGTVLLLAVRTIAVVLFTIAFAIFIALLIGGTVFLVGRRRLIYRFVRLRRGRLACFLFYILRVDIIYSR